MTNFGVGVPGLGIGRWSLLLPRQANCKVVFLTARDAKSDKEMVQKSFSRVFLGALDALGVPGG